MLTPRQLQILRMCAGGLTYQQAATALQITGSAISVHWRHIRDRLGAKTNLHAVAIGYNAGLIREGKAMNDHTCEAGACICVDEHGEYLRIWSTYSHTKCQVSVAEFVAFRDEIKAGKYDHIGAQEGEQQ